MKIYDYIKNITNGLVDLNSDSVERLVYLAYWFGKETATKDICDKASDIFHEQQERAKNCRYKNMAIKVQGDISKIYSNDYSQDMIKEFGNVETNLK